MAGKLSFTEISSRQTLRGSPDRTVKGGIRGSLSINPALLQQVLWLLKDLPRHPPHLCPLLGKPARHWPQSWWQLGVRALGKGSGGFSQESGHQSQGGGGDRQGAQLRSKLGPHWEGRTRGDVCGARGGGAGARRCLGWWGWQAVAVGSGAHLGLEGPLQGTKGDSRREARRQAGHRGREGRVGLRREGHRSQLGLDARPPRLCPSVLGPHPTAPQGALPGSRLSLRKLKTAPRPSGPHTRTPPCPHTPPHTHTLTLCRKRPSIFPGYFSN